MEEASGFFEFDVGKPQDSASHYYQSKIVVAPVISYEAATSFGFGIGSKLLFKPKSAGLNTRTSNIPVSVLYTLNKQFIFSSEYVVFFPNEEWLLKGNFGFSKYPVSYFGIGRITRFANEQEIDYNNILFEPLLLKKLSENLFVGGGIRFANNSNVKVEDSQDETQIKLADDIRSRSLGLELAMTLDSRDNVLNASNGSFLEFTHGFYDKTLGSTNSYMLSKFNYRKYFPVNTATTNVIAIEFYGRAAWGKSVPILELSSLGGSEFLRGYQEGRFRDKFAYFSQIEYRWQTWESIGFVFFGGLGDVMANENFSFNSIKYTLGSGLRLKIVKSENINIRLDYGVGIGDEIDSNFFLGISEAF